MHTASQSHHQQPQHGSTCSVFLSWCTMTLCCHYSACEQPAIFSNIACNDAIHQLTGPHHDHIQVHVTLCLTATHRQTSAACTQAFTHWRCCFCPISVWSRGLADFMSWHVNSYKAYELLQIAFTLLINKMLFDTSISTYYDSASLATRVSKERNLLRDVMRLECTESAHCHRLPVCLVSQRRQCFLWQLCDACPEWKANHCVNQ